MNTAGAKLKVVSTMSVGYGEWARVLPRVKLFQPENKEHVDLVGLAKRGVRLGYTPDVLNDAGGWITTRSLNPAGLLENNALELNHG